MTVEQLEAAVVNLQRDLDELRVMLGEIAEYAADRLTASR